jgi:hypothetical protein
MMGSVDLERFLDELRIPHELDLALSRDPGAPDEKYQRLRDTQSSSSSSSVNARPVAAASPSALKPPQSPVPKQVVAAAVVKGGGGGGGGGGKVGGGQQDTSGIGQSISFAPPPPQSKHHQELLKRLNSSEDFGSHKQDLSIVKLNPPDMASKSGPTLSKSVTASSSSSSSSSDSDKMLSEYMNRIHQVRKTAGCNLPAWVCNHLFNSCHTHFNGVWGGGALGT